MSLTILRNNINFTPYEFYTYFLDEVAKFYKNRQNEEISFKLINESIFENLISKFKIEPISLPLLVCLFEQVYKIHKKSFEINIEYNALTKNIFEQLNDSNFFEIVTTKNLGYKDSLVILKSEQKIELENIEKKDIGYKLETFSINQKEIEKIINDESKENDYKRDILAEYLMFEVENKFSKILNRTVEKKFVEPINFDINRYKRLYAHILSELIANGVFHSKSNTYALIHSDFYNHKFSVADNGIGFEKSLNSKSDNIFYELNKLRVLLDSHKKSIKIPEPFLYNLITIFEVFYYSILKDRIGLIDTILNVVLQFKGYFRIHSENCQIIISNRYKDTLNKIFNIRDEIIIKHDELLLGKITNEERDEKVKELAKNAFDVLNIFYLEIINNYVEDVKFSSIRFFSTKFKGVHIEFEIPNN